ncbi:MAG: thioredoxin family protein [Nonlabens sp.]
MNKLYTVLALVICQLSLAQFGQMKDPVAWSTQVTVIDQDTFELTATATLDEGWHIYSQTRTESLTRPTATVFEYFDIEGKVELLGVNEEIGVYAQFEEVWGADVYQFSDKAVFKQRIKLLEPVPFIVVQATSQACNEVSCLMPTPVALTYTFNGNAPPEDPGYILETYLDQELTPVEPQIADATAIPSKADSKETTTQGETQNEEFSFSQASKFKETGSEKSYWLIFLGCVVAGLLTLLTPCVFPMIPMTVSFFTKQTGNKARGKFNGVLYGVFIVLIYTLFSLPFYLFESFSPDFFYEFSTNPWLNLVFFTVFVIFAISFFGAFEITLPNSLINKVDGAANLGGIIGVFFMALTLVLVSFSCTGLVIGGVLGSALSTDGGAIALTFGLFGFGIGLGIPFSLFALFPRLLDGLPKSGGWLNTVKVFLGFVELAFAFKFLSNADLVWQAGILPREIFLAIWIAIFGALALYLFGKITLPHDDVLDRISVGRLLLGIGALFFTVYLIPGMWGAPVKILSGFTPPQTYAESVHGVGFKKTSNRESIPKGAKVIVHDLIAFEDLEEGIAYAKEVNKPIMIDFTGWTCVNCRKMEDRVWSNPRVLNLLKTEYVLVSLYLDELKSLAKEEQVVSQSTGKKLRTVGNKWSDFQISRYGVNVQPYYAIIDSEGNDLVRPVGYTPDPEEYAEWLESGLQ